MRVFGTAVLTINYGDYELTKVPGAKETPVVVKPTDKSPGRVEASRARTDMVSMSGLKVESELTGDAVRQ